MSLELRRELFSLIAWHMHGKDRCGCEALTRLVVKGAKMAIRSDRITVSERAFKLKELQKIRGPHHSRANPIDEKAPLILFSHRRKLYVIDGQNRINKWEAEGNKGPFQALVVSAARA